MFLVCLTWGLSFRVKLCFWVAIILSLLVCIKRSSCGQTDEETYTHSLTCPSSWNNVVIIILSPLSCGVSAPERDQKGLMVFSSFSNHKGDCIFKILHSDITSVRILLTTGIRAFSSPYFFIQKLFFFFLRACRSRWFCAFLYINKNIPTFSPAHQNGVNFNGLCIKYHITETNTRVCCYALHTVC